MHFIPVSGSLVFYEIFKSAAPQASRMIGLPSRQRPLEHVVFRTIESSHQKKEENMTTSAKPIPEGFHSVTPGLVVRDAAKAIDFYKKALSAQEVMRMPGPDGKIMHAELKIGDSIIFLNDERPQLRHRKSPQPLDASTDILNEYVRNG